MDRTVRTTRTKPGLESCTYVDNPTTCCCLHYTRHRWTRSNTSVCLHNNTFLPSRGTSWSCVCSHMIWKTANLPVKTCHHNTEVAFTCNCIAPLCASVCVLPSVIGHWWGWWREETVLHVAPLERLNWTPSWSTQHKPSWCPTGCLSTDRRTWASMRRTNKLESTMSVLKHESIF